jgi:magnesium transporter
VAEPPTDAGFTRCHLLDAEGSQELSFDVGEIKQRIEDGKFFWIDVHQPDESTFTLLKQAFGFHPLALDDSRAFGQRPKLDEYDGFAFLVAYGANQDEDGLVEVHFFCTMHYLVTLHRDECPAFTEMRDRYAQRPQGLDRTPTVLHRALDAMTDSFFPLLADIDTRIDDLEDRTFSDPGDAVLGEIFALKRFLVGLRKVITPQRDMFATFRERLGAVPGVTADDERYYRDIYDHLIRISDLVDSYRDLLSSAMDVYLSSVSNRLNVVMKQLAVIATVFLPMSFVVGFFGQNFAYMVRNIDTGTDFWLMGVASELLIVAALLLMFRRRGWF